MSNINLKLIYDEAKNENGLIHILKKQDNDVFVKILYDKEKKIVVDEPCEII